MTAPDLSASELLRVQAFGLDTAGDFGVPERRVGDVFTYTPDIDWTGRPTHHCREAWAIVVEGRNYSMTIDTFWGTLSDAHILTDPELATLSFEFNTDGYDELEHRRGVYMTWEQYNPFQREIIPSQHGLQRRYFVAKGAVPDTETLIENARAKVEKAESELRSAEYSLTMAKRDLDELLVSASVSVGAS